jgi:hypothetical protein
MLTRAPGRQHRSPGLPGLLLVAVVLLGLAAATPALAKSGRVGPETRTAWEPGALAARLAAGADTSYGIWDAQPTGTIAYARTDASPQTTLTATDATGATVWSATDGDFWSASGTLPAALVASFTGPDPNVLRDGVLRAYAADGRVIFHKAFTRKFVQPLADTAKRLVWLETSAKAVTRVFVRQGSKTRSVALPYVPPKAHFVNPAAASANGRRIVIGEYLPRAINGPLVQTYWVQVDRAGTPRIVSHRITQWGYAALSPKGDKAAVMAAEGMGDSTNRWVSFGRFSGPAFESENAGEIYVSDHKVFQQGSYTFETEAAAWGTYNVTVYDWQLYAMYKRAWTFDDATSSIWFRHDGQIRCVAGVTNSGALTVVNTDSGAIASVPGTYADAVPIDGGRLVTMTKDGTLAVIDDPVAGP